MYACYASAKGPDRRIAATEEAVSSSAWNEFRAQRFANLVFEIAGGHQHRAAVTLALEDVENLINFFECPLSGYTRVIIQAEIPSVDRFGRGSINSQRSTDVEKVYHIDLRRYQFTCHTVLRWFEPRHFG